MSTETTFLKLHKPDLTDPADITAMNENWDIIDENIQMPRYMRVTPAIKGQDGGGGSYNTYTITAPWLQTKQSGLELIVSPSVSSDKSQIRISVNNGPLWPLVPRNLIGTNTTSNNPGKNAAWFSQGSLVRIRLEGNVWTAEYHLTPTETLVGAVAVENGGTGAATLSEAKDNLGISVLEQSIKWLFGGYGTLGLNYEFNESSYTLLGRGKSNEEHIVVSGEIVRIDVTKVAANAFKNDSKLKVIWLPRTISTIEQGAFEYTPYLEKIDIDGENPYFMAFGRALYNNDLTTLIKHPSRGNQESIELWWQTETIKSYAFNTAPGVKKIYLPSNIKTIEANAFCDLYDLTDVYYERSESEWRNVSVGPGNFPSGVTMHYNA